MTPFAHSLDELGIKFMSNRGDVLFVSSHAPNYGDIVDLINKIVIIRSRHTATMLEGPARSTGPRYINVDNLSQFFSDIRGMEREEATLLAQATKMGEDVAYRVVKMSNEDVEKMSNAAIEAMREEAAIRNRAFEAQMNQSITESDASIDQATETMTVLQRLRAAGLTVRHDEGDQHLTDDALLTFMINFLLMSKIDQVSIKAVTTPVFD